MSRKTTIEETAEISLNLFGWEDPPVHEHN